MAQGVYDPGRMNRKIFIEQKSQEKGPHGAITETWNVVHVAWADIESSGGPNYRINLRYLPNIKKEMRVRTTEDEIYRIISLPMHARDYHNLTLQCEHMDRHITW